MGSCPSRVSLIVMGISIHLMRTETKNPGHLDCPKVSGGHASRRHSKVVARTCASASYPKGWTQHSRSFFRLTLQFRKEGLDIFLTLFPGLFVSGLFFGREHLHVVGDDFNSDAMNAILICILSLGQATFDVDLLALLEVLVADLSQVVPGNNRKPLGLFFCLPARCLKLTADGQGEFGHSRPVCGVFHFRVTANITDKHNLV